MDEILHVAISVVETIGVVILLVGLLLTTARFAVETVKGQMREAYVPYRRDLGRTLLLALEFLVAADLLETLTVKPTLESVGVLTGLIIVRTILSFALDFEMSMLKRE